MVTHLAAVTRAQFFPSVTAFSSKGLLGLNLLPPPRVHTHYTAQPICLHYHWNPKRFYFKDVSNMASSDLTLPVLSPKPSATVGPVSSLSLKHIAQIVILLIKCSSQYRISFNMHFQILYILQVQPKFYFLHKLSA